LPGKRLSRDKMTIQQLIDRYLKLYKQGYETMIITQVINDLRQCQRINRKKEWEKLEQDGIVKRRKHETGG